MEGGGSMEAGSSVKIPVYNILTLDAAGLSGVSGCQCPCVAADM
jgi:hypothetical protein